MKVKCFLTYPKVTRHFPGLSDPQRCIPIELNIMCDAWKQNTAMRQGFCELIFAGAGNHPGLWDGYEGYPFDSGDAGINNVHRQWAAAPQLRSMSVGDLINIDPPGLDEWWLCDSVGWILLTAEQAKSWLEYPRKYGCDSFELKEWMEKETGLATV